MFTPLRIWLSSRKAQRLAEARRIVVSAYTEATKTPSKIISASQSDQTNDLHRRLASEIGREWVA